MLNPMTQAINLQKAPCREQGGAMPSAKQEYRKQLAASFCRQALIILQAVSRPDIGRIALSLGIVMLVLPLTQPEAHYASIVIDSDTGAVLHAVNADTRNYPASLVKMMTLYMAFEALKGGRLRFDQPLEVSQHAAGMAPSKLGLKFGQKIRVKDALLAIVTKSANDAAVVLAETLSKTEQRFAQMMTEKARELGMTRTHFRNATGLPNPRQHSTAHDMALLATGLLRDFPEYYRLFSVTEFSYNSRTYTNHNRLLENYAGTDGIKTGYTRASGFNLAASVERGDHRLVAVVFGGKTAHSRDRHMIKLLDEAFAEIGAVGSAVSRNGSPQAIAKKNRNRKTVAQPEKKQHPNALSVGRYGAQVGAYYRYSRAKTAASRAADQLPKSFRTVQLSIPKVRGNKGPLFLARLIGLSKEDAHRACRFLRSVDIDCLAVRVTTTPNLALK